MENVIPPVILVLVLRCVFPAMITWFFERFVEPRAEIARQNIRADRFVPTGVSNSQKIEGMRKSLHELRARLETTER